MPSRSVALVATLAFALASPVAARAADDPDTEIARRHFDAGVKLYDAAQYEGAIAEFQIANHIKPVPAFDFNIARCYDRLERVDDAITYYARYVDSNPPPPIDNDGGARERLKTLRARKTDAIVMNALHVDVAPRMRYGIAVPAAVGGVAVAALVVGGALYGVSGSRRDGYIDEGCGVTKSCGSDVWGGTRTMERTGIGLMIAGGIVAAVDVGLWAAWRRHK